VSDAELDQRSSWLIVTQTILSATQERARIAGKIACTTKTRAFLTDPRFSC
jgi:hypothetical protein